MIKTLLIALFLMLFIPSANAAGDDQTWKWIIVCKNITVSGTPIVETIRAWNEPHFKNWDSNIVIQFYDKKSNTYNWFFYMGPNVLCKSMTRTYYENTR